MTGRSLLHYTIEAELGAGAMGRVYLARDQKTERRVALKFLALDAADEDARARLLREGRAAARLSHPGIVSLHAIEETDGEIFLVEEFVEGESLANRLERGSLGTAETLRLARELTSALVHAHERGVLHRDLKPANILIARDGSYKIADFGLARLEGASTLTSDDKVVGTLPYLAPERINGDAADARSDLFALGAVLYEAASGRRAFPGRTQTDVLLQVLNTDPPALQLPGAPAAALSRLITRLLAKDPHQRPASAEMVAGMLEGLDAATSTSLSVAATDVREFAAPLAAGAPAGGKAARRRILWAAGGLVLVLVLITLFFLRAPFRTVPGAAADPPSIAVLYFENVSDPSDADRIGAITGNLLVTSLAQTGNLEVLSTQTVLDALYRIGEKGGRVDRQTAMKVAREIKAGRIITGSILQTTPFMVMTTEVTDVHTGKVVHAARVEGQPGQTIFDLVDGMGLSLMEKLGRRSDRTEPMQPVSERASGDLDALRDYIDGLEALAGGDLASAEKSLAAAVEHDSTFAQALFYRSMVQWWQDEHEGARILIAAASRHAARLTPMEQDAVTAVSLLLNRDFGAAEALFVPLAQKYPKEKIIVYGLLESAFHQGHWPEAVRYGRKILELDPDFTLGAVHLVDALLRENRLDESESVAEAQLSRTPKNEFLWMSLLRTHIHRGNGDEILKAVARAEAAGADPRRLKLISALVLVNRDSLPGPDYVINDRMSEAERVDHRLSLEYFQALRMGQMRKALEISHKAYANLIASDLPIAIPMADGFVAALALHDSNAVDNLLKKAASMIGSRGPSFLSLLVPTFTALTDYRLGRVQSGLDRVEKVMAGETPEFVRRVTLVPEALLIGRIGRTAEALEKLAGSEGMGPSIFNAAATRWARVQIEMDGALYERAVAEIDTLLGAPVLWPSDIVLLHFQRAQALEKLNRPAEAIASYREFLRIWREADPDIPELLDARRALVRLGAAG